jgi:hypothetical protein
MFPSWNFYRARQRAAEAPQLFEIDDDAVRPDNITRLCTILTTSKAPRFDQKT